MTGARATGLEALFSLKGLTAKVIFPASMTRGDRRRLIRKARRRTAENLGRIARAA